MVLIAGLTVEAMRAEDIPEVQAIEREVFLTPWPKNAYQRELLQNRAARYLVLREGEVIRGYGGLWRIGEEAHITTIGVRKQDQGQGVGRALFAALLSRAYELGARWVTLEVRASNDAAIHLYERFQFKIIGRRRGYYTDDGEDALVMWSDNLNAPAFKENFGTLLTALDVAGVGAPPPAEYPAR
ncbi:MAG TPA: ribosomal protein S18-alanine N-acetyltransferase [Candidatus Dormibacteraeota bacterium]|nr:ribosomal protein S18-alanine N-acetyltransferase [Candidatus Dormibacteraeota bacterium]